MNTNISQEAIDATQSPDLLNIDISLGGKSVKKRQGYGLDATLAVSTSAVHNLYKFFDSSGNEVRLAFNDNKVSSSINGATWSTIITTGTVGATWDCTDYLGFAYCVSSAFDNPIKTNGTTSGTTGAGGTNAVPAGSLVSNSGDRLLVGATAANPSRLYYSQSTVFSNFALGVQPSDSSYEDIVAPGSKLTHLSYHYGRWLWWKDQSFGFIVGTGQFDLQVITVSNTIGTRDNTDVYDNGITYFRGTDGQIYTYDGSNLSRAISTDIAPTLQAANRQKFNSWYQTSNADFSNGSGFASYTDTTTTNGAVTLFGVQETWTSSTSWTYSSNPFTWTSGSLMYAPGTSGSGKAHLTKVHKYSNAWYVQFDFKLNSFSSSVEDIEVGLDSGLNTDGYGIGMQCRDTSIHEVYISSGSSHTHLATFSTSACDTNRHTLALSRTSSGLMTAYLDGTSVGTFTHTGTLSFSTPYLHAFDQIGGQSVTLYDVHVAQSTGTYYSAINNAPNISAWSAFSANASAGDGTLTYYTRASTTAFSVTSSTPTWVAQTNGSKVAASTGTYMQARVDFAVTAATQTPTLNDFTLNWFEGVVSEKMYGTYFNNGILFSVSIGTSTTTNNRIFRYDLLSHLWTLYDIPANGFVVFNNNLYFAGPSTGCVFQFGNGVYSDNGSAINSYWKSKPFFGDSPFTDKDLRMASWYIAASSGTTLALTYTLNESTTVTKNLSLYDSRKNVIQNNWNFPLGSVATNFNVQFGDNSTNAPWEVFGGGVYFVPRPWRVSLQ